MLLGFRVKLFVTYGATASMCDGPIPPKIQRALATDRMSMLISDKGHELLAQLCCVREECLSKVCCRAGHTHTHLELLIWMVELLPQSCQRTLEH